MIGQGLGPGFTIVATRISVIFRVEGLELVLTPLGYASIDSEAKSVLPRTMAEVFRISRRSKSFLVASIDSILPFNVLFMLSSCAGCRNRRAVHCWLARGHLHSSGISVLVNECGIVRL